jgi:SAM-dependent methyltransferase
LLDVGCAHGWFVAKAGRDFEAVGIEPDPFVAERTRRRGIPVRAGFFPQAVAPGETFDVIVFNDVLEHIPGTRTVLDQCRAHLARDGLVVVNAPNRRGTFYRASRWLHRLGWRGPFARMWQAGLPSPHLYYFDDASMARIAAAAGFRVERARRLPSVAARGLYSRIRAVRDVSLAQALVVAAGTLLVLPLLRVLPPDIGVWFLVPDGPEGD